MFAPWRSKSNPKTNKSQDEALSDFTVAVNLPTWSNVTDSSQGFVSEFTTKDLEADEAREAEPKDSPC